MTAERTSEYTPTTDVVRTRYVNAIVGGDGAAQTAEFDRWLAQVIAEAEARGAREALLSAADEIDKCAEAVLAAGSYPEAQAMATGRQDAYEDATDRLRDRAEQAEVSRG